MLLSRLTFIKLYQTRELILVFEVLYIKFLTIYNIICKFFLNRSHQGRDRESTLTARFQRRADFGQLSYILIHRTKSIGFLIPDLQEVYFENISGRFPISIMDLELQSLKVGVSDQLLPRSFQFWSISSVTHPSNEIDRLVNFSSTKGVKFAIEVGVANWIPPTRFPAFNRLF